jgi:hypothetical protein
MKQFKLLTTMLICVLFASCSEESTMEDSVVVEQINSIDKTSCSNCLEGAYDYLVTLKSRTGTTYYYTNYKHEVGDTLLSIFEFTDNRDRLINSGKNVLDSIMDENVILKKKNDELGLYNSLLLDIIKNNVKNSEN